MKIKLPTAAKKAKPKAKATPKTNGLIERLNTLAILLGIPRPTPEHRFHPTRKWRFDAAYPAFMIAVEYEGMGGRHQTWTGYINDTEKYNEAKIAGWLVLQVTCKTIDKLPDLLQRAFAARKAGAK